LAEYQTIWEDLMKNWKLAAGLLLSVALPSGAYATDLEVTHWWTSGGEAAAVAELAKAFDASGDHWVDGAIAGGGDTARPVMIARITGGDPMGATQFNHGQQALELVQAGLMLDLTDVAEANKWRDVINPISLLDGCTIDGKVYCAPMNIHSPEWLWINNKIYEDLGRPTGQNLWPRRRRSKLLARSRWLWGVRLGSLTLRSTRLRSVSAGLICGRRSMSIRIWKPPLGLRC
jgi:ABC-type glycerol-3-phosphate transport system substrate-binding protein